MIKINFLDHVAIRVADLERSAKWYEEVLGLERYQMEAWGDFPIFMLSGKTGIAIFPADPDHRETVHRSKGVKIDHFAFNVDKDRLKNATQHYEKLGLKYEFQDHIFFQSVYTKDPDGHTVELTSLVVDEKDFYKNDSLL